MKSGDEKGAAAVELAVALPILLLMVFGLIQAILLVNTKTVLEHAAYEGARTAAVGADAQKAKSRALRVTRAIPRGAGFLGGKPQVKLSVRSGSVGVEVRAKIVLLPFFRQASLVGRGDGTMALRAKAERRIEPFLGY